MKYTGRWTVRALTGAGGGSGASISIGVGPGCSEPGDPMTPRSWGPMATSGDWDPSVAPGSSAGPRSGDPDPSVAPNSYAGPGS
jgi:hypothetical protein